VQQYSYERSNIESTQHIPYTTYNILIIMMTTLTSSADLEAELSAAKSRLAQLQQNNNGLQQAKVTGTSTDIKNNDGASESAAQKLYQRAQIAQDEIEYIALNRHVIKIMSEKTNSDSQSYRATRGC